MKTHKTNLLNQKLSKTCKSLLVLTCAGLMGTVTLTACNPTENESESKIETESENDFDLLKAFEDQRYQSLMDDCRTNYLCSLYYGGPLGYFEDLGYSIGDLSNNNVQNRTYAFISEDESNTLYMCTYIEDQTHTYYIESLLAYHLPEDVIAQYSKIFESKDYRALCINTVIDDNFPREVISTQNVDKTLHSNLSKIFGHRQQVVETLGIQKGNDVCDVLVTGVDDTGFIAKVIPYSSNYIDSLKTVDVTISGSPTFDNNILTGPNNTAVMTGLTPQTPTNITIFKSNGGLCYYWSYNEDVSMFK